LQADGATSLFSASQNGHDAVVKALLECGAAINQAAVRVVYVSGAVVYVARWALWAGVFGGVV
jgi:ankyrin repeat protein